MLKKVGLELNFTFISNVTNGGCRLKIEVFDIF
jgi:hypothetical protein